jgi:hypothetical protein
MNKPLHVLTLVAALGFSGAASAAPVATTLTPPCNTIAVAADTTCSQYGQVFSQASLANLTATARIDTNGPYSFSTQASVFYYTEILSSTGVFNDLRIPLLIQANGYTEVGGVPPTVGSGFNNNQAHANFYFGGTNVGSACSGAGCSPSAQASFSGFFPIEIVPTANEGYGPGIFRIQLTADVNTNSNYPTSSAYAYVDPYIQIDPTFQLAHPEYSLAFSANVTNASPVPVPAAAWLFGSGLLGLIGVARRKARTL